MVATPPQSDSRFRPEIQGLRAVAVLLVVLFHLFPGRITGGFIGVDVFFVISGYLITSHIARELRDTGTVSLRRFWARRVRRLLPASFVVLAASAVLAVLFLPATMWENTSRQLAASALYVQNWLLASDAVDYLAADNVPTVAQHYWSLSVEEQFYLVWPALLLILALLHRKSGRAVHLQSRFLLAGLGMLTAVSFTWSVIATYQDQASAYFITPTRVWEFAAGAMLALVAVEATGTQWWRRPLGWLGLAAIVAAAIMFDSATMFPGYTAALPVLGTVAVIVAGNSKSWLSLGHWLALRPMRFVGDISYSVYLWHWPLIIVWPYATNSPASIADKAVIVIATGLLAWATKVWVEDPGRSARWLSSTPWHSFAFAAVTAVVIVVGSWGIHAELDRRTARTNSEHADVVARGCYGPVVLAIANECGPVEGSGPLWPPPEVVVSQNTNPLFRGCQGGLVGTGLTQCEIGTSDPTPSRTVALVGDSHATQWFSAFEAIGRDRGWRIVTFSKASCPFTDAIRLLENEQTSAERDSCEQWADAVTEEIIASGEFSQVYTASFATAYAYANPAGTEFADPAVEGYVSRWQQLADAGLDVIVLGEVPRTKGGSVPNCLAANPENRLACASGREVALAGRVLAQAVASADHPQIHLLDMTHYFCDTDTCHTVVGDLIVYRDSNHISAGFAIALVPYLLDAIDSFEYQSESSQGPVADQ